MDNQPHINCWYCGAEQTELVKRIEELEKANKYLNNYSISSQQDRIEKLEAERSEVVSLLKEYANDTGAVDTNLKARVKMYLAEHKL